MSTKAFYIHHTQRISGAAAVGDTEGLLDTIRSARQQLVANRRRAAQQQERQGARGTPVRRGARRGGARSRARYV